MSRSLLAIQSSPADTQKSSGPALVASSAFGDPPDVAVLKGPQVWSLGLCGRVRLEPPGSPSREPLQVLQPDHAPPGEGSGPFQQVFELSHVARVIVGQQRGEGLPIERQDLPRLACRKALEDMAGQTGNVFASFS